MKETRNTNRLAQETSPYLLQHAHNPVDWYPWGAEAFERSRRENKPILLSIGYSACHWCHVMERESFEDENIARVMNENFINIKVDREERPDLDQIYMTSVQMMTGQGGWPMTVFLTPEGVPFYGGTYFPPEERYNMPSFHRVLTGVADAYKNRPDDVSQTAQTMLAELQKSSASHESSEPLTRELLDHAFGSIARTYDPEHGGFGRAPKFPAPMSLDFLLRYFKRSGSQEALKIVEHTCQKMAAGGIYDQLGGGFHRYSTDSIWLVPHFEKMLYDNAQMARLYLHLYQVTHNEIYERVARETLDYVLREMTDERGGFYATQDADSEGHEGKFFVWSSNEIDELLPPAEASAVKHFYGVTSAGNFEGQNILNVAQRINETAREIQADVQKTARLLQNGKQKLFDAREKRIKPGRDEKIITAWNGLMIAAFAEAGAILGDERYSEAAKKAAGFMLDKLRVDGRLLRTYKDERARFNAYLEDYSFLAEALLTLFETAGGSRWLDECLQIVATMIEEFWDNEKGGFHFTGNSHEKLIARTKDYFDNATPSGNSVAVDVLLRLSAITGNKDFKRSAVTVLRTMHEPVSRYPSAFGRLLCALDFYLSTPQEIVIMGDPTMVATRALMDQVWSRFLPNAVIVPWRQDDLKLGESLELLQGRSMVEGKPTAYVCENFTCKQPITSPEELGAQLESPAGA